MPPNEQLVYDAACALKDRHLLVQGRLFVFEVRATAAWRPETSAVFVRQSSLAALLRRTDATSLRAQQRIAFFSSLFGLVHKKTLVCVASARAGVLNFDEFSRPRVRCRRSHIAHARASPVPRAQPFAEVTVIKRASLRGVFGAIEVCCTTARARACCAWRGRHGSGLA